MKLVADLHMHTNISQHAYSTLHEMVQQAQKLNFKCIAITEHGPKVPDAPNEWYFCNLASIPNIIEDDFLLLKGVEANVIDSYGSLDMPLATLQKLDWVIASIHNICIGNLTYEEVTHLWLKIAENPCVDMIGHSEQREFFYDYDLVTKAFAANNKVVEMNASSAHARPGNEENLRNLALACKKNNTKIAVNSDAHSIYSLGNQGEVIKMLEDIEFPQDRIINTSMPLLIQELQLHNKNVAKRIEGKFNIQ